MNNSGPKIDPCVTQKFTVLISDFDELILNYFSIIVLYCLGMNEKNILLYHTIVTFQVVFCY